MTLFILEKNLALCWFGKGLYIIIKIEHFLIHTLIHIKLNSLMRKCFIVDY